MSFVQEFRAARYLHKNGRVMEALSAYLQLLQQKSDHAELLFFAGAAELQLGQFDLGIRHLQKSLEINPNQPLALSNLGMAMHTLGRFSDALEMLAKAEKIAPNNPGVHFNRANTLQAMGRMDEALLSYARTIELAPDFAPAHNNSGIVLQVSGRLGAALKCFSAAIDRSPHFAEAYNNRGNLLRTMEKRTMALEDFDNAIKLKPDFAEAFYNRGNVLLDLRQPGKALASLTRALEIRPTYPQALDSKGVALRALGRTPEAVPFLDEAVKQDPNYIEAYNNRGIVRQELGDPEGAAEDFRAALKLQPDYPKTSWNLALVTLLSGDYETGWELFEHRWTGSQMRFHRRDYKAPLWNGEDISGKTILLYAEQGFGDTLQFCRYAPMVAARGAKVVLEVQPELKDVIATLPACADGTITLMAKGEDLPEFDVQCPLMSLPRAFKTRPENIPGGAPYLFADGGRQQKWAQALGKKSAKKRIGLVVSGSQGLIPDITRSVALEKFAPLFALPAEFHLLQKDVREKDAETLKSYPQVTDHAAELKDFTDTAALIAEMDLVISVDTAVAHLAGALGKPVWLMVPLSPDWRWMRARADSPWYETMRIFRQPAYLDWDPVVAEIVAALS